MPAQTIIRRAGHGALGLILLLSCQGALAASGDDWTMIYPMDVMPATGGWFGVGTTRATIKDGVLHIVDDSDAPGSGHMYQIEWGADPASEAVAEVRMKVVASQGDAGVALWLSNGVREEGIQFYTDRLKLAFAGIQYPMNTTRRFHVYRATIRGEDLKVYVDGKLAIDATGRFINKAHQGRNLFGFGSASSTAKGESLWDWVRFRSPLQQQIGAKPPEVEQVTIFRQEDTYAVFPSLQHEVGTDRLAVSFRAGGPKSHFNPEGASNLTFVSEDGGRSWKPGSPLPSRHFSAPNGRLLGVNCKWWQYYPGTDRERLQAQGYRVEGVRPDTVGICVGASQTRSSDGGRTWEQQDIKLPFMAIMACGMNSLQLADGTLLVPVYGRRQADSPESSWVMRSDNYGETWELQLVAEHPNGLPINEPAIIELKGGRLLIVMRLEGGNDHMWQAFSDDRGKTWHSLRDTGVKGHPPNLLRLQDGRLLLTYGYRHPPFGIRAAVSDNEGETWDVEHLWTLREDGGGPDLGYPRSVQLGDGTVVTVYYFVEPGGMQYIAGTRWKVPVAKKP